MSLPLSSEPLALQSSNQIDLDKTVTRGAPSVHARAHGTTTTVPPRPQNVSVPTRTQGIPAYQPTYSGYGGNYGGYGSYGGYQPPYSHNPGYGGYTYGLQNAYGMPPNGYTPGNYDMESRFVQFAEETSRNTFANVENVVRAVNSISTMLDNTFFAMTSSFRAFLSVAENFGHLRNMFGQIWYSLSVFRLFRFLYTKLMRLLGVKVLSQGAANVAWKEAIRTDPSKTPVAGNSWGTVAFLGVLISAPYLISKFILPKYEDNYNPEKWKTPGYKAKAITNFKAAVANEMNMQINDDVLVAPKYIQDEMKLINTGWVFAISNGHSGIVPVNHLIFSKRSTSSGVLKNAKPINNNNIVNELPVMEPQHPHKNLTKRVSFGENQIIEINDTDAIVKNPKPEPSLPDSANSDVAV